MNFDETPRFWYPTRSSQCMDRLFFSDRQALTVIMPGKSPFVFLSLRFSFSPFSPLFFFPIPLYYPPNPLLLFAPNSFSHFSFFSYFSHFLSSFIFSSLFLQFFFSHPSLSLLISLPSTELIKVRETSPHFLHMPHVISMFFPYFLFFFYFAFPLIPPLATWLNISHSHKCTTWIM